MTSVGGIARLSVCEPVWLDRGRLDELGAAIGIAEAERLVGVTFDELGEALGDIDAAFRAGEVAAVLVRVGGVAVECERIGLAKIAAVARSVTETGQEPDAAAFAATVARLVRLLETCLTAACEAPDMIV